MIFILTRQIILELYFTRTRRRLHLSEFGSFDEDTKSLDEDTKSSVTTPPQKGLKRQHRSLMIQFFSLLSDSTILT